MRQALHIFRKDARHLQWEIALVLLITAFAPYAASHDRVSNFSPPIVMLPLVWWFLIGRLIHSEALPGNKQFWLTRPYSRGSLFMAKVLFLLAFVTLPMIIADTAVLLLRGFEAGDFWAGLLFEQVLLAAVFLAPAAAIATLTATTARYVAATLALGILAFAPSALPTTQLSWGVLEWLHGALMIAFAGVGAIGVAAWQYGRRNTVAASVVMIALVALGSVIPTLPAKDGWFLATRLSSHWWEAPWIVVTLDQSVAAPVATPNDVAYIEPAVRVELLLRLLGLPKGLTPRTDDIRVNVAKFQTAARWETDERARVRQVMLIDAQTFAQMKDQAIDVVSSATVTLTRGRRAVTVPVVSGWAMIPGIGVCQAGSFRCQAPFRPPEVLTFLGGSQSDAWVSYSPFPAEIGIDPLSIDPSYVTIIPPPSQFTVTTEDVVSHFHIEYTLRGVRLADFQVRPQ